MAASGLVAINLHTLGEERPNLRLLLSITNGREHEKNPFCSDSSHL